MDNIRGSSPVKSAPTADSNEQLLSAFKAAALSVTKLYKISADAQAKSRAEGYQDCVDDLLSFLDKQNIGLGDGEGWQIRRWATERLEGTSEDEVEKADSPEVTRTNIPSHMTPTIRNESAPPAVTSQTNIPETSMEEPQPIAVPTQDNFTFQSSLAYPQYQQQDSYLNLDNLNLSDSLKANENGTLPASTSTSTSQTSRSRRDRRRPPRAGATAHLGKGAGQKRSINFAELFDMGNINFGNGKDPFGREGKRSRHQ
ncbi:hypothetical protein GGR57DRAFT_228595 [Xylariaceae sp. FL1272]|nr:hypothetical protein GGR57DRAFT_228595 [Xylariaceae sp. FL1272]